MSHECECCGSPLEPVSATLVRTSAETEWVRDRVCRNSECETNQQDSDRYALPEDVVVHHRNPRRLEEGFALLAREA